MVDPAKFGEDHAAKWKRGTSLEETARIAAAYAQHHAAIEVREKLNELGESGEWLALTSRLLTWDTWRGS